MGQGRVELPTSRLSGVRSNHLSYWPSQAIALAVAWPKSASLALATSRLHQAILRIALAPWKLNRTLPTVGLDLVVSAFM